MTEAVRLIRFDVEGQAYALALDAVEQVVRAVALSPLPGGPPVIRGIFNLHGRIVPVADPRRRLGLPDRDIELEDRIVVARTPRRALGLLAHGDTDVVDCPAADIVRTEAVLSGLEPLDGIGKLPDGLVLIHDISRFLSIDEERSMDEALHAAR